MRRKEQTLTGHAAIRHAEAHGITLSKYADPTEDAREGLSADEARDIAAEDPSLIYVDMPAARELDLYEINNTNNGRQP